jgi:orotate phosphoribosyltransferase
MDALRVVHEAGASVSLVLALVDRGGTVAAMAEREGLPFVALFSAPDLGFPYEGA